MLCISSEKLFIYIFFFKKESDIPTQTTTSYNISSDLGGVSVSHDFQNVSVLLIGLYIMNFFIWFEV